MKRILIIFLLLTVIIIGENPAKKIEYPKIITNKDGTLNYIKDTKIPSFFKPISGSEDMTNYYGNMEIYNENNIKIAVLKFEKDFSYIKALIPIYPEEILYKKIILKELNADNTITESFFIRPEGIMKGGIIMRNINKSLVVEGDLFTEEGEIIDFEYPSKRTISTYTDGRKVITELEDGKMITKMYNSDGSFKEEIIFEIESEE